MYGGNLVHDMSEYSRYQPPARLIRTINENITVITDSSNKDNFEYKIIKKLGDWMNM